MGRSFVRCALFGALVLATATAAAQVRIGVTVSATGPAASLGIPERNTIPMCPKTAGGKSIEYIVLDDASDTTTAVQNTRKLMGESKVDALIGSTTTPNSLAYSGLETCVSLTSIIKSGASIKAKVSVSCPLHVAPPQVRPIAGTATNTRKTKKTRPGKKARPTRKARPTKKTRPARKARPATKAKAATRRRASKKPARR